MRQFFMQEHFADLKQAYITGLLKALSKYTPDGGASFVSFKEHYAEREILDYIRSMRTGFTVQSLAEYAKLRKAMAVWDKYDRSYADTAIEAVASELGETADDTKEILLGACSTKIVLIYISSMRRMTKRKQPKKHTPIPHLTHTLCI